VHDLETPSLCLVNTLIARNFTRWSTAPRFRASRPISLFCHRRKVGIVGLIALLAISLKCVQGQENPIHADNQITLAVDENRKTVLPGDTVPNFVTISTDEGRMSPFETIGHLMLVLRRPTARQLAFEGLLHDLYSADSPRYHQWLTPSQIGANYGPSDSDLAKITTWLESQGLRVEEVSDSRTIVTFTGTSEHLESAFSTELHRYKQNGVERVSVNRVPALPAAFGTIVQAVIGLSTLSPKSTLMSSGPTHTVSPKPMLNTPTGTHAIFPGDFASIYDLNLLYESGITGAGQTVAVIGQSRVSNKDIEDFEALSALPILDPQVVIPTLGTDPQMTGDDLQIEATLDIDRVLGTAPGANAKLVVSADNTNGNGIQIATQYAIQNNLAQIVTISFSGCEVSTGKSATSFYDSLFSQAAAQGISVFVGSGDSGAAGCDTPFTAPPLVQQKSTNYICASGYATCVGGTEFVEGTGQYWSTSNSSSYVSALSYIPEGAWNESTPSIVAGTGGGASLYISKPSWQTGTGVPSDGARDTPDVALSASVDHDPYAICAAFAGSSCGSGQFEFVGGTSAAAPGMAGIQALVNERVGHALGNINSALYSAAANSSLDVFHDITPTSSGISNCVLTAPSLCNNSTSGPPALVSSGVQGYAVTAGYDQATGLGSIDGFNWAQAADGNPTRATTSVALTANPTLVSSSEGVYATTLTAAVTSTGTAPPVGVVQFYADCLICSFNGNPVPPTALGPPVTLLKGQAVMTTSSTANLIQGAVESITALYNGDLNNLGATSPSVPVTTLTSGIATATSIAGITPNPVAQGQKFTVTAILSILGQLCVMQPCAVPSPAGPMELFIDGVGTGIFTNVAYCPSNYTGCYASQNWGNATLSTSIAVPGTHQIMVTYTGGDDARGFYNFNSSSSSAIALTVTGPLVSLSPATLSFGSQLQGTSSATQVVTLTNSGSAALSIASIMASGDFSQTNNCGTSVATGARCSISIVFTPTAPGSRSGSLTITDGAYNSPQTLALSGTGMVQVTAPDVTLSPASLTFASQTDGTASAVQTVTLTSSGGSALNITSIAASGDFAETNTCGTSVAAGASCSISVTFTPTAAGARTGTLTVTDNAGGSPQTVALGGGGEAVSVSSSSSGLTIASAGGSATAAIQLSSVDGFTGTVNLTCAVSYQGQGTPDSPPTCSLSPSQAQVTSNSPVSSTLTVSTTAASAADTPEGIFDRYRIALAGLLFLGVLPRRRWRGGLLFTLLCLVALGGTLGCSGGNSGGAGSTSPSTSGTTTGNYKVAVTATSGTVTTSTTIPLSLQ